MTANPPATPVPFWQRLRDITLYPVRGAAFVTLITLTLASLLGNVPGVGWLLGIIVWLAAYKYSFEILRATADGKRDSPEVVLEISDGTVWRFIGLQIIFIAVTVIAGIFGGPVAALVAMVLVALMQPGCIMSLAIDGSLPNALNPATALSIIARIGAPYFAAFGLLFVIQVSTATAGGWLAQFMPIVLGQLVVTFFAFWGLFSAFHLMGYLVYQYHDELGYDPDTHRNPAPRLHAVQRDSELLEQAQALVRDGNQDAALALLREEVRSRVVPLDAHELYRRLLRAGGDRAAVTEHARLYLHLLMSEKRERPAMNLLREALQDDPAFVPLEIEHGEQLASRARLGGQAQLARDQWLALLRAHPRNPSAPQWALDAALLMAERFGQDAQARRLLEQALLRCEDAALRERIDSALKAIPATAQDAPAV